MRTLKELNSWIKFFLTDDHSEKVSKNKKRVGPCFQDIVSFEEATFGSNANFHTVTFVNDVTFFRAKFMNITYFFRTKFCEMANFNECTFLSKIDFRTTYFEKGLFRYVRFVSEVYFMDVIFKNTTLFNYTIFEQPNETVFGLRDKDLNYSPVINYRPHHQVLSYAHYSEYCN